MDSVSQGQHDDSRTLTARDAEGALQLAVLRRVRRILEIYCGGLFVVSSDEIELAYAKLRHALLEIPAREVLGLSVGYDNLSEALPVSLGAIEPLIAGDIWGDYVRPAIDSFRGEFLAACVAAGIDPLDTIADEVLGSHLGYDQPIDDYKEIKQAGEQALHAALQHRHVGLRQAEDAAEVAMREAAEAISRRRQGEATKVAGVGRPRGTFDRTRADIIADVQEYLTTHDKPTLSEFQERYGYRPRTWSRYTAAYGFTWTSLIRDCQKMPQQQRD